MSKLDKRAVSEFTKNLVEHPSEKAIDAVMERRLVKLYCKRETEVVELYVFQGRDRSYILFPGMYCSCKDFELNVVLRGHKGSCYHLVALEIARKQGKLKVFEVTCEILKSIALELLLREDSTVLRKIVYSHTSSSHGCGGPEGI